MNGIEPMFEDSPVSESSYLTKNVTQPNSDTTPESALGDFEAHASEQYRRGMSAENARLKPLIDALFVERDDLRAENERLRPIVEAAFAQFDAFVDESKRPYERRKAMSALHKLIDERRTDGTA